MMMYSFIGALVAADWGEEDAQSLISLIIDQWITVRGFSYASTRVEEFKKSRKKSVQKLKGLHKQLWL